MEYPISLDIALAIVGSMKVKKIKEISFAKSDAEKENILQEIDMYIAEENMLYGTNELEKLSVMDKVVRLYGKILREENSQNDKQSNI